MKKLLWISRHDLTQENKEILKKAFGEFKVEQYSDTVDAEKIRELGQQGYDAAIVVLPPQLLAPALRSFPAVYRFIVEREVKKDGTAVFTPTGLEKIVEVRIVTEQVV